MHHLENPQPALAEFRRTLKPGGFLILEVANKMNFKARLSALLKGKLLELEGDEAIDKRSNKSKLTSTITFVNHNPTFIRNFLLKNGFKIQEVLSVSNFRSLFSSSKTLSVVFLFLDKILYQCLAKIWFGPSIIFLARKNIDGEKQKR